LEPQSAGVAFFVSPCFAIIVHQGNIHQSSIIITIITIITIMATESAATAASAASAAAAAASSSSWSASWIDYDVSADFLHRELAAAERALQHNEERRGRANQQKRQKKQQQNVNMDDDEEEEEEEEEKDMTVSPAEQLSRMDRAASELLLVKDVADWSNNSRQNRPGKEQERDDFWTARCCEQLGRLLVRHAQTNDDATSSTTTTTTRLYANLVQREYLPLYEYIYMTLLLSLRRALRASGYPAKDACTELLNQADDDAHDSSGDNKDEMSNTAFLVMAETAKCLMHLQRTHKSVVQHVLLPKIQLLQQSHPSTTTALLQQNNDNVVLIELMRPIVERVRYHFVESSSSSSSSKKNSNKTNHKLGGDADLTFARLDRLPEWLLRYLGDTLFGQPGDSSSSEAEAAAATDDSPFDVVSSLALYIHAADNNDDQAAAAAAAVADDFVLDLLNEVVRLVQWVFGVRGFFQHASVAGQHSKPNILMNAIEQFIQFDALLRSLVPRQSLRNHRLLSLMDIFVTGNDELCHWWLEREREALYYTLFNDDDDTMDENKSSSEKDDDNKNNNKNHRLLTRISPRTEIFCALLQSVQQKALQFNYYSSVSYLQHVATPLCMQFLDAIHETANALKSTLSKRPSVRLSLSEANAQLEDCIRDWMELINGTHLCAVTILRRNGGGGGGDNLNGDGGDYSTSSATAAANAGGLGTTDPDLERIGKSLQRVERVLCDEFCSIFVESVLLERAKLAVYLMKCSHIFCSADYNHHGDQDGDIMMEVSHDLQESWRLLAIFLQVCEEPEQDGPPFPQDAYDVNNGHALACHAPRRLRHGVLDLLSEKFLEVALDPHEMSSPDILQAGCRIFLSDMQAYFGFIPSPERVPKSCLRLLNVAQVMATPSAALAALGNALVELVQVSPPLHVDSFLEDEQLYNQAMSMIQAKGWVWIEDLNDVLSILNRRRDLMNSDAF
jgi:hypothetical protein